MLISNKLHSFRNFLMQYYKKYGYNSLFFCHSFVNQENIPTFAPDL